MARRDIINFNFLKKAIEQRYRFRNDPNNVNFRSFRGIPFGPQTDPHSIFGRIYTTFRELSRTKRLILNQYLNIEDKNVLEKLFQNLERDPNLRFLNVPDAALNDSRYELSDQYYLEQSEKITEAQKAEQLTSTTAPSGPSTHGMPGIPAFSPPAIVNRPQVTRNTPLVETKGQTLYAANKSGAIVAEKEITPTGIRSVSQGPSEFHITDRHRNIVETYSKEPISTNPKTRIPQPQQPSIILADRYGSIKQPEKPAGKQTLYTQDKNNIIKEHTVKPPSRFNFSALKSRVSSGVNPLISKIGRASGPSIKKGLGSLGRGITGLGRSGLGAATPALRKMGTGVLNGAQRLSQPGGMGGGAARLSKTSNKVAFALVGGLIFFVLIAGGLGGLSGATPTGEAAPLDSATNLSTCKFTRSGISNPIKSSTLAAFFQEAEGKTGVPAAALASLAMHESPGFTSNADNNHDAFGNNTAAASGCAYLATSQTGALGLMQIQPSKKVHDIIAASGKIPSFENVGAYSADGVERGAQFIGKTADTLTLQDFCDIKTSVYLAAGVLISKNGGKPPTKGGEINKSVCGYYGACQYGIYNYGDEAETDFKNCKPAGGTSPAPAGPIGFSLTCPVGNSTVTCGTEANPVNNCGHGGISYEKVCNPTYYICQGNRYSEALYYAIDIKGKSSNVVTLPFINGNEPAEWTRIDEQPVSIGGGSWGYRVDYKTTYKGRTLILNFTHLNNQINPTKSLASGTQIGTYITTSQINHLHTGLSVDGRWIEPIQQAKMCTN